MRHNILPVLPLIAAFLIIFYIWAAIPGGFEHKGMSEKIRGEVSKEKNVSGLIITTDPEKAEKLLKTTTMRWIIPMYPLVRMVPLGAEVSTVGVAGMTGGVAEEGVLREFSLPTFQVKGVFEPDIFYTDGKALYAVTGFDKLFRIGLSNGTFKTPESIESDVDKIILDPRKKVLFSFKRYKLKAEEECIPEIDLCTMPEYSTDIEKYNISGDRVEMLRKITVDGRFITARYIDGKLVVVTSEEEFPIVRKYPFPTKYVIPTIQISILSKIHVYLIDDNLSVRDHLVLFSGYSPVVYTNYNYLIIATRIWENPQPEDVLKDVVAVLREKGYTIDYKDYNEGIRKINAILKNVTESEREELINIIKETVIKKRYPEKTHIYIIDLKNLNVVGHAVVPGIVENQWCIDQRGSEVRVVTYCSLYEYTNLYVLNVNGSIIGELEGIEKGERTRGVLFFNDKAIVVTFRQIDPFLTVDLRDPSHPKILGVLKLPGYSKYLFPINDTRVIGVGVETNEYGFVRGLKVSLFDISNISNPKELSRIVIPFRWSEALSTHLAFSYYPEKNIAVLPAYDYREKGAFAIIEGISSDNLKLVDTVYTQYYPRRTLYVGDNLYMFADSHSLSEVIAYSLKDKKVVDRVEFSSTTRISIRES